MELENFDKMGKKRIIQKETPEEISESKERAVSKPREMSDQKISRGTVHIQATYNNTIITVADEKGNVLAWSSAGSLGFSGAKKATPFAAARVSETVVEKAKKRGIQDVAVFVRGVGSGRDSAIRALANNGLNLLSVKDATPLPHNGPRPKKVRRV